LLEHIGELHHEKGATILDAFASVDGENLGWLRSDLIKNKEVCLLKGENVDIQTEHDVKMVENLSLKDLQKYDFIISSHPCYLNRDHEYYSIGKLVGLLYKRLHWQRLLCMIAREASSLWYSRIKVSESQTDMKSEALYMFREMRHLGVSLVLDSLRLQGIDIDLRTHTDFLLIKSQGIDGLPDNLSFLYYNYFNPAFLRNMDPSQFALVCRKGSIGAGHFPYHSWHKIEKEDIVSKVGLKIEYGQEVELPTDRGTYQTVTAKEHSKIVQLYSEGLSMMKVGEKLERSSKTISDHVHAHDNAVRRSGFCPQCRSIEGALGNKLTRTKKKPL